MTAIEIGGPWRYDNEGEALHFVVRDDRGQRRVKLKRSENAALFDFLADRVVGGPPGPEEG